MTPEISNSYLHPAECYAAVLGNALGIRHEEYLAARLRMAGIRSRVRFPAIPPLQVSLVLETQHGAETLINLLDESINRQNLPNMRDSYLETLSQIYGFDTGNFRSTGQTAASLGLAIDTVHKHHRSGLRVLEAFLGSEYSYFTPDPEMRTRIVSHGVRVLFMSCY